jgi:peroxiredoxin-like protein
MNNAETYTFRGTWTKGNSQIGQISTENLSTDVTIGKTLSGTGNHTNPEELLLSAAASCYMITLSMLLENRNIPFERIELTSEALVENDKGLRLDKIIHYPHILIDGSTDMNKVVKLAHHAEHTCMVSSALRGNVEVIVLPRVTMRETSQNT